MQFCFRLNWNQIYKSKIWFQIIRNRICVPAGNSDSGSSLSLTNNVSLEKAATVQQLQFKSQQILLVSSIIVFTTVMWIVVWVAKFVVHEVWKCLNKLHLSIKGDWVQEFRKLWHNLRYFSNCKQKSRINEHFS